MLISIIIFIYSFWLQSFDSLWIYEIACSSVSWCESSALWVNQILHSFLWLLFLVFLALLLPLISNLQFIESQKQKLKYYNWLLTLMRMWYQNGLFNAKCKFNKICGFIDVVNSSGISRILNQLLQCIWVDFAYNSDQESLSMYLFFDNPEK